MLDLGINLPGVLSAAERPLVKASLGHLILVDICVLGHLTLSLLGHLVFLFGTAPLVCFMESVVTVWKSHTNVLLHHLKVGQRLSSRVVVLVDRSVASFLGALAVVLVVLALDDLLDLWLDIILESSTPLLSCNQTF